MASKRPPPSQRGFTHAGFTLSHAEKEELFRDAESLGMTASSYLRTLWLIDREERGLGPPPRK